MSATVPVHLSVGDPTRIELCPRCLHATLATLPVTAVLRSGVMALPPITACLECDSATSVVAAYRQGGSLS